MDDWETLIDKQMARKQAIDDLPDSERYTARQRWIVESIELLLQHAKFLSDRRQP
jgi:hypothetical protein